MAVRGAFSLLLSKTIRTLGGLSVQIAKSDKNGKRLCEKMGKEEVTSLAP